jgi:FAD/FMN-containing dehydrogenase
VRVCDFGHWGDGGTHLNLVWKPEQASGDPQALAEELQAAIYDLCVRDFGGSYSAEHGVGPHNQRHYQRYTPQPVRDLCAALKRHFDPERRLGTVELD